MTMKIGGILAAAILIAAALPARAQETYPTPEAAVKDLVELGQSPDAGLRRPHSRQGRRGVAQVRRR